MPTDGAFDPTLLVALVGLGYGPSWAPSTGWRRGGHPPRPPPVDRRHRSSTVIGPTVALADGVQLDPGAIGKGLAADIVAEELLGGGAASARVVVGGDVRVTGPSSVGVNGPDRTAARPHRPRERRRCHVGNVPELDHARRSSCASRHRPVVRGVRSPVPRPGDVVQVTVAAASAAACRSPRHRRPRRSERARGSRRWTTSAWASSSSIGAARRIGNEAWARMRRPADRDRGRSVMDDQFAWYLARADGNRVARPGRLRARARPAALDPCAQAARPPGVAPGDASLGEHAAGRGHRRPRAGARRRQLRDHRLARDPRTDDVGRIGRSRSRSASSRCTSSPSSTSRRC